MSIALHHIYSWDEGHPPYNVRLAHFTIAMPILILKNITVGTFIRMPKREWWPPHSCLPICRCQLSFWTRHAKISITTHWLSDTQQIANHWAYKKKTPLAYLEYNKQRQFYHSQYISVMICVLLLVVSIQIEFPVIILKLNEAIQIDSAAMKTYRITGEKTVARQHLPAI